METQPTAQAETTTKRGKLAKVSTSEDFATLTFSFGPDGAAGTRQVQIAELAATHPYALAYGYRQILQDSYAGSESPDHALAGFDKRFASLVAGEIRTRGDGEAKEDPTDILVEAWMLKASRTPRADGRTLDVNKVKQLIESSDKSRRAAIRKTLAAEIYEVRAERARKSGDKPSEIDLFSDDLAA
jgi:hypothetical protein